MDIQEALRFLKSDGYHFEEDYIYRSYRIQGVDFTSKQVIALATYRMNKNIELVNTAMAWME
ncbi:hypothetical protein [Brevibacillus porteri]|uniref:hypothetical protein n=1 Tax=Brevibacillus porteri TaxID=2126350 RepID=UPI003644845B